MGVCKGRFRRADRAGFVSSAAIGWFHKAGDDDDLLGDLEGGKTVLIMFVLDSISPRAAARRPGASLSKRASAFGLGPNDLTCPAYVADDTL